MGGHGYAPASRSSMNLNHAPTASFNAKMEFLSIKAENPRLSNADDETIERAAKQLATIRIEDANRIHEDLMPVTA